jgi:hypothetical protein
MPDVLATPALLDRRASLLAAFSDAIAFALA